VSQDRFRQAEEIFYGALELSPDTRPAYVLEHTTGDQELFSEVSSLLEAYEQQEQLSSRSDSRDVSINAARTIGAYQLDGLIGKGGMGAVYLAHRSDGQYEQTVAIKLIALPMATEYFRERFRQERQILATLDHPNITRLIDGGMTQEGDPYLVMEYVDGRPLDRYCDEQRLSASERLQLFAQALNAVDYAHQHLIVHGDLKPSNILVTGAGVVKVVDFGTSRFIDEEAKTLTAAAMTPKYASPEQLRGENLTTASDVFSLGMILFELLTGGSPFATGDSFLSVFERAVNEKNPVDPADAVTDNAAAQRQASALELRQYIRGDLSSIVLKALAHDPFQRYRSVAEFTADLENHKLGRPVLARRQTFLYRAGKFARRHRTAVVVAAVVAASLLSVGTYAYREQAAALEEGRQAKVMNTFLMRLFQSINPSYGGRSDFTPRELVDRAAAQADTMLGREPAARAQFMVSLGANMVFTRGVPDAIRVYEKGSEAARQSGDFGLQAETDAFLGYLHAADNDCGAALKSIAEAEKLRLGHQNRMSREWRFYSLINEAKTAFLCGGDPQKTRRKSDEALALARQISDDSLEEGTPPPIMKAVALILSGQMHGCDGAKPYFDEVAALARDNPAMAGQEAELTFTQGLCLVTRGEFVQAVPLLRHSVDLGVQLWGEANDVTREYRAYLAYSLAEAGQSQPAVENARASVANLRCGIPFACQAALAYGMEALMTAGDDESALPIARQIAAANGRTAIVGKTGLFVALAESNDKVAAQPYRAAAQAFAPRLARGRWRTRIEKALAK